MKKIGKCEVASNVNQDISRAYNTMHVVYIMQMEWGIGGLKNK
jgi:hypothetical protein